MKNYALGTWILVTAAAVFGCGSSTDAVTGGTSGGGACVANADCTSGLCLAGACASGKPGGGSCATAADCASGVCQASVCVGNGQGVPAGGTCTSSDQCASGTCTSGACASGTGLSDGKSCASAAECATGACTKGVCGTGTVADAGGAGSGGASSGGTTSGSGGRAGSGATGSGGLTGTGGGVAIVDGGKATYGSTQCTDGKDNDGDGRIDAADPECTGPLDNDESSFATGIPGDNVDPKWQDCFFDGNSGAGDDGCRYNTGCLTGTLPQTSPSCQTTQQCQKFCKAYAPNGCDCFGCCAVPLPAGGTKNVFITSTCSLADINDPTKCPTCVQSADCLNTCDKCELCVGKDTLPPECTPPPGTGGAGGAGGTSSSAGGAGGTVSTGGAGGTCAAPSCPTISQPCGLDCLPACPTGQYCLTGCCITPPR
jgi:hypothetical protein